LRGLPEIVECDRIIGEDCFIARAHVPSVEHLARLRLRPTRRVAVVAPIAGSLTSSGKTSLKDR
jgi:DNA-binding Lrp family transcriptional regulator